MPRVARPRLRTAAIFLGALWAVVAIGAVVWGLGRVEDDLGERTADALAAAGLDFVDVEIDGRDVTVRGAGAREAEVVAVVEGVRGVREVDFGDVALAGETEPTVLGTVVEREPTTTTEPATTTTTPVTTTTAPATTTTTTPPTMTTPDPPRTVVEASLQGGRARLSGVVPDQATAEALIAAANVAYAPFLETDLDVDAAAAPEPWLAGAPVGIGLLPMITEGTIRVEGDGIMLSGESPNEEYLALFEQAVAGAFGLSDVTTDVAITNLAAPRFVATRSGGVVRLAGELPSEEIRQVIVNGALGVYGPEAVVDETTVEEGLYTSFWMYTMPVVFQIASPFPEYELLVQDGVTTGALRGGASFAFDSAELTPEIQQLLGVGAALLSRDLSLGTLVTGHTDSVGPDAYNQRLSERRARNAVDFLVNAGISPDRLRAVGLGETQPLASNHTDEGRTVNRRVEFVFGPVQEVVGGE